MAFSYLATGYNSRYSPKTISIYELFGMICHHPDRHRIEELRTYEKGMERYDAIKRNLPCIKANGFFKEPATPSENEKRKEYCNDSFAHSSGFLYFDIDAGDADANKQLLLEHYRDVVCMVGKSVGGKGLFFFVQLSNPEVITKDNLLDVQNYFKDQVFTLLTLDNDAKGVCRNHVISYDPDVYMDLSVTAKVPISDHLLSVKKTIISGYKFKQQKRELPTFDGLVDIKETLAHIKWKTEYDIGDEDYTIGDFQYAKLFFRKEIADGKKHKTYRMMVNTIMFNNPDIELKYVESFINYINQKFTGEMPMLQNELKRTVRREYDRIKETGDYHGIRTKHVLTNPNLSREERQRIGSKASGIYRRNRSVELITGAVKELAENGHKPTQKAVAEVLAGKVGIATIQRHWRSVVPKTSSQAVVPDEAHGESVLVTSAENDQPVDSPDASIPKEILNYVPVDDGTFLRTTPTNLLFCKQWLIRHYFDLREWEQDNLVDYLMENNYHRFFHDVKGLKWVDKNAFKMEWQEFSA